MYNSIKVFTLFIVLLLFSCAGTKEIGKNFVNGGFESLNENQHLLDSLAARIANQIVDSAVDGISDMDFTVFEDDINSVLQSAVQNGLLDKNNKRDVFLFVDSLMIRLDRHVIDTASKLPRTLLNDELISRIDSIKSSLLGEKSQKELTALVRSALSPTAELRTDLKADVKEMIDYANDKGTGITDGLGSLAKTLIGGAVLIILALGFAIYLIRKKLKQYREGLLKTAQKIDRLDRTNYDKTKLKPEDFKSSPETYKTVNKLIAENEELFENKKRYKNYHLSTLRLLVNHINVNYSEEEIEKLIEVASKRTGKEAAKFLKEEIRNQR